MLFIVWLVSGGLEPQFILAVEVKSILRRLRPPHQIPYRQIGLERVPMLSEPSKS